jgi:hypothetical protein
VLAACRMLHPVVLAAFHLRACVRAGAAPPRVRACVGPRRRSQDCVPARDKHRQHPAAIGY